MPILLDNVKCRGDESTIAACRHNGWRQNDCVHSKDASVVCWTDSAPPIQGMDLIVIQCCRAIVLYCLAAVVEKIITIFIYLTLI